MPNSDIFKPIQASPTVSRFFETCPRPTWQECLVFLLKEFPQVRDGRLVYLVDGGVAVTLLAEGRDTAPTDVDFIIFDQDCLSPEMFGNKPQFGAKGIHQWLRSRQIEPSPENIALVRSSFVAKSLNGTTILVLSPKMLVLSKQISSHGAPRLKDVQDVRLLGIAQGTVDDLKKKLTTKKQ